MILPFISIGFFLWYVITLLVEHWKDLPKSLSASSEIYGWLRFILFAWGMGVPMLYYPELGYVTDKLESGLIAGMGLSLMFLSITVNVGWDEPTRYMHFIFSGLLFALGYLFVYLHFGDYKSMCVFILISIGIIVLMRKRQLLWIEIVGAIPLFYWMVKLT